MKKCAFVLIICIALTTVGTAAANATEQHNVPPSIKTGECYVQDYGKGVYFFHSWVGEVYRDEFGRTMADFIEKKNKEGYELAAMAVVGSSQGYWVIFRKKPSR